MGAYGYYRDTTPWLSKQIYNENLVLFKNAFSCHSHTDFTVPYIISSVSFANPGLTFKEPTIINNLHNNGYETWWISNQEKVGVFTQNSTPLALEAKHTYFSTESDFITAREDEIILQNIKDALDDNSKSKFIAVHIMGSHGRYKDRYPTTFTPNLGPKGEFLWGKHSDKETKTIDEYDHSIAYTDLFLSKLVSSINKDSNTVLLYVSDHGESVINPLGHTSTKILHHNIFAIPLFIWSTQPFKDKNPEIFSTLNKISNNYITNDKVYDLLMFLESGQGDISKLTSTYKAKTLIRHGENNLDDLNYSQVAHNINKIKEFTHGKNLLLHRANSIEKLRIAGLCDFDGVEIDLIYDNKLKKLMVGHDSITDQSLPLELFLEQLSKWNYKRVWLYVKNCKNENANEIFNYIEQINKKYQIKSKTILELSTDDNVYSVFKNSGWFVSYYLIEKSNDPKSICEMTTNNIKHLDLSGLSFDIDSFNKINNICPDIFKTRTINTWILSPRDIDSKNTISSHIFNSEIVSYPNLDSILIGLDTEADI